MARVKGKQARYFPVVIKIVATTPTKDDIVATVVDLAKEGIEIRLKLFAARRSCPEDILPSHGTTTGQPALHPAREHPNPESCGGRTGRSHG